MRTLLTGEQLEQMSVQGKFELVRGKLVSLTPPGLEHGEIALNVAYSLKSYIRGLGAGRVVVEAGFYTQRNPDTVRGPDVSMWAGDRLEGVPQGFLTVVPDLVVEVVSPHDTSQEVELKLQEYFRAGVRRAWVLYPATRTLHALSASGEARVLQVGDFLRDEQILPGFQVQVQEFFRTD